MIIVSRCGNDTSLVNDSSNSTGSNNSQMNHGSHSSSGELLEALMESQNPTFEVGSQAIINAAHMMDGMEGATATIVGAYDTSAYAISFTPTTGGERVTNHKWVNHEEIQNAAETPYEPGTEVTEVIIEADHMEGMRGATAIIDSAEQTTVYMIDFSPTTGGEEVPIING